MKQETSMKRFFINLLWFNMKKLSVQRFWRVILVLINLLILGSTILPVDSRIVLFILVLGSLANILFMYTRINAKQDSITLLRSIGASRTFIHFDNIMEVMLEIKIAMLIYLAALPFTFKLVHDLLWLVAGQVLVILVFGPVFSFLALGHLDRINREI